MTNHIEEMMRTAGCEYVSSCYPIGADCSQGCNNCERNRITYCASFTAEKQLELIKLICETEGFCGFTNFQDENEWSISCGFNFPIGPNPKRGINFNPTFRNCETFEQALAQLTTELMKAGELDKSKVKEILSV